MNPALLFVSIATIVALLACGPPQAELEAPASPLEPLPESPALEPAPGAHAVVPLEHPETFQEVPPEALGPALEDLLRLAPLEELPPEGPQSVEWAGERDAEKREEAREDSRVRIDFSRENVTEGVPMQKDRHRTNVGVSVPVGSSEKLRVRGGVRVDEREISDDEREAKTAPTVGVEVQF